MLVLAIETATPRASISLTEDDAETSAWREETHRDICRRIAPQLERVLAAAGGAAPEIDLVAVGLGPGSFTSMRVGIATAKAFAAARGAPLVGVPSLQAMAWQMRHRIRGAACPVLEAGRGEMYAAIYQSAGSAVEPVSGAFVADPAGLAQRVRARGEPVTVFGQMDRVACDALRREIEDAGRVVAEEMVLPDALAVAQLGWRRYADEGGDDIASLRPVYVRMSYAEERFDIDLGLR
jgi:tRNA threonylcarbamoyladenosine biosynthesis protein TsaB